MQLWLDRGRLAVARGFNPVDAGESQGAAEKLGDSAAFAEENDAEDSGGDGEQIAEGAELGDFEIAEEPEIEKVSEDGTEKSHVEEAEPGGCGD
jgi:hypothetical protein